jgi:hypothetical protein
MSQVKMFSQKCPTCKKEYTRETDQAGYVWCNMLCSQCHHSFGPPKKYVKRGTERAVYDVPQDFIDSLPMGKVGDRFPIPPEVIKISKTLHYWCYDGEHKHTCVRLEDDGTVTFLAKELVFAD